MRRIIVPLCILFICSGYLTLFFSAAHRQHHFLERELRAKPYTSNIDNDRALAQLSWSMYLAGKSASKQSFLGGKLVGTWYERGANKVPGKAYCTTYESSSGNIYEATSGGSLWKSTNLGGSWTLLSGTLYFGSPSSVDVIPLTAGHRILITASSGIYYTDDEGLNWNASSVSTVSNITVYCSVVDYSSNSIMFAFIRENGAYWLLGSWDKGLTFSKLKQITGNTWPDMWSTQQALVNLGQPVETYFRSDKYAYKINYTGTGFTGLDTIQKMSAYTGNSSCHLQGVRTNGKTYLYHKYMDQLYRSNNGGQTWTMVNANMKTFSTYDGFDLHTSLIDSNLLYYGEIDMEYSADGGVNWIKCGDWTLYNNDSTPYVHGDVVNINSYINGSGQEKMLISTDGGLYTGNNHPAIGQTPSLNWSNMRNNQYYDVYTATALLNKTILATAQDQGLQYSLIKSPNDSALLDFKLAFAGDMGIIVSGDSGVHIWMSQPSAVTYGDVTASGFNSNGWADIDNNYWTGPVMADLTHTNTAYAVGRIPDSLGAHVIKVVCNGSFNYTTTQYPFDFSQGVNDEVAALNRANHNPNKWYVATRKGKFYASWDAGQNWTLLSQGLCNVNGLRGGTILVSNTDSNKLYYCGQVSNLSSQCPFFYSNDGGNSWIKAKFGFPTTGSFIMHDIDISKNDSLVFAATENGPYVFDVYDTTWYSMYGPGAPVQHYSGVQYVDKYKLVRFSTIGRGIVDFRLDIPVPDYDSIAQANISSLSKPAVNVYPNPSRGMVTIKAAKTIRQITVMNASGIKLFATPCSSEEEHLDLSGLAGGLYFININYADGSHAMSNLAITR